MKLKIDTATMSKRDGVSIVALMFGLFPDLGTELENVMIGIKTDALTITGDAAVSIAPAAEAFAPPSDTPPVPPADQAFAGADMPQALGDDASADPIADGAAGAAGSADTSNSAPAAAPAGGSVELDATGLPWDARIHSEKKSKNADGSWRGRRGVPPQTITAVREELRRALGAPAAAPPPPAANAGNAPPAPPAADAGPSSAPASVAPPAAPPPSDAAPAVPPAPAAPTPPASDPTPSAPLAPAAEFARVMRKVTEAQTAGRITADLTTGAVQATGLTALRDLLARPDLIPSFETTFDAMLAPAAA